MQNLIEDLLKLSRLESNSAASLDKEVNVVELLSAIHDEAQTLSGFDNGDADLFFGSNLADVIDGASGNDILVGFDGNDTLEGGSGADTILAGAGNDALVINEATEAGEEIDGGRVHNAFFQHIQNAKLEIRRGCSSFCCRDFGFAGGGIDFEANQIGESSATIGCNADGLIRH